MGALARIRTGLGLVALAATFALASPGVSIVRAEEATTSVAGQCSAGPVASDAETRVFLEELRREQLRRQSARGEAPTVVMLNNRGYNYGPPPSIGLDQVQAEMRRAR